MLAHLAAPRAWLRLRPQPRWHAVQTVPTAQGAGAGDLRFRRWRCAHSARLSALGPASPAWPLRAPRYGTLAPGHAPEVPEPRGLVTAPPGPPPPLPGPGWPTSRDLRMQQRADEDGRRVEGSACWTYCDTCSRAGGKLREACDPACEVCGLGVANTYSCSSVVVLLVLLAERSFLAPR